MVATVYSLGHSNHSIEKTVSLLKVYRVDLVWDVRSVPYSKSNPVMNAESLSKLLQENDLGYEWVGESFGGKPKDRELYTEGYADFEKICKTKKFQLTKHKLFQELERGHFVCLMCAEKDPIDCHRAIMIGRNLSLDGVIVDHILENRSTISQRDLDSNIVKRFYPIRSTYLFLGKMEDAIAIAYRKMNREIGYRVP